MAQFAYFSKAQPLQQIGNSRFYRDFIPRTYQGCKVAALNYGLIMASIHSNEENNLVFDGSVMYLGAYRTGAGNSFEWEDRSGWDYDNWDSGEPNNADGVETAVAFGSRGSPKWNDVGRGQTMPCLFSKIPVGPQVPPICFLVPLYPILPILKSIFVLFSLLGFIYANPYSSFLSCFPKLVHKSLNELTVPDFLRILLRELTMDVKLPLVIMV